MEHLENEAALEERIDEWRSFVQRRGGIDQSDVDELEDHLRSQVADLQSSGLDADESFLIAVKRIGELDSLSREFAREHSERLWKRLVVADNDSSGTMWTREVAIALALAVASALAIKVPELFGQHWGTDAAEFFYIRNFVFFSLPFLAAFFVLKRSWNLKTSLFADVSFVAGILAMNLIPFEYEGHTMVLAVLHLPIALWLAVGIAYVGDSWNSYVHRMNFVRFTGEWFIYLVLIALGGGLLMGSTMFIFGAIGFDAETLIVNWIIPCGIMGAVIVAAWLVEAKKSVIENMAPVLTMLFTPLFTILLLAFLVTMLFTGSGILLDREVLIGFDLILVLVVALLLYSMSARDPQAKPGLFDFLQLALVVSALLVNAIALWAILSRIAEFGYSPNRIAALGENLILVVNLTWSAVLYVKFVRGRGGFVALEKWQTAYLPVYAIWAWIVVVIFPFLFNFK